MTDREQDDAEFRELLGAARKLPKSIEPPRDLWPGIAARIGGKRWWRERTFWAGALAAAAVLVVVFALYRPSRTVGGWMALEADYRAAALDLSRALDAQRGKLRPETVAVIERNLRVIDAAIRESREALARDPNNAELRQLFAAAYRQKVELLRWATRVAAPVS